MADTMVAAPQIGGDDAKTLWQQTLNTSNGNENAEETEETDNNSAKLFERSRIKALADERETVQKKTFCKWVNSHLSRVGLKIQDLYVDLRDGKMLIKLLEVLSGERLPNPTKGKMRIHCLENVDKSLLFLNEQRVHLENMGAHDIVDGNPRLTLGLIWTIILRFQIQGIEIETQEGDAEIKSAKDALLLWCQMKTAGYPNVNVRNFTTSWRDGLAFNALIHKHRPDLIDYDKLTKSNALYNLNNAFHVAEDKLGLTSLLDAEDVNHDYPDERSIMTYVVTYYHYFSKMKAESVQGRRVGKVINQCREYGEMIHEYESMTSDLLEWIKITIRTLEDRHFANSLNGVQEQLAAFNSYRTVDKPVKFTEKGDLEIKLFQIQSQMRGNNQKPYTPSEGKMVSDINKAWEQLESAEHSRELALREELVRQEKLEQLASRFYRKASMREAWLSENQRLVSQDNFGYDLAAVEAATKKHEAIETDINAYEERVQAVVSVARELESENYHDIDNINSHKDNVLQLWQYLLELLRARRLRLELSLSLQKIFQEMLYILDWMDEIKSRLQSEDFGKHLVGVDDLMQKHHLLESDIGVVGVRVTSINNDAQQFIDGEFEGMEEGYKPCDPEIVRDRIKHLEVAYEELLKLAADRLNRLGESRKMWQFYWDMADEDAWIKEKEQLMSSPDLGHDLTSVQLLINKHKANEDELNLRHSHLQEVLSVGQDLIKANNFGSDKIQHRISDIENQWKDLNNLAAHRKQRLIDALNFYQLFADAEDVDKWCEDMFLLVSSEDVGHDEASAQSMIRKHKLITDELQNYATVIDALHVQASQLTEKEHSEVTDRLADVDKKYNDLKQLAELRKQRLLDALALYTVFNEADGVEQWIVEKEKLLHTIIATTDVEEVEILKARFETFDNELKANANRVGVVNKLSSQLLDNEHPDAEKVLAREKQMNEKWAELNELANQKRTSLDLAHDVNTFHVESLETMSWIREKEKLIESTDELKNDLSGMITLQRRLGGLERDLAAIQAKLDALNAEADRLQAEKPEEAEAIRKKITELTSLWLDLKQMLKVRDERLGQVSELQKFLQDLDHFQQWLSLTQSKISSEEFPNTPAEAEQLLAEHASVKGEIDAYNNNYEKMKEFGDNLVEGQEDPQYILLRERLKALNNEWLDLHRIWESKQNRLIQSKNLQEFLKEIKQAEVLLSQQDNFLSKEETPTSVEQAENLIRQHEVFVTTLDANDDKINNVLNMGQRLINENNYMSKSVQQKIESLKERRDENRQRAIEQLERLRDALAVQQLFQDCDELDDWIAEKTLAAQDETYRDAKNIHSKWTRHQAFELELKSNKGRLENTLQKGQEQINERPDLAKVIQPRLDELSEQWKKLEDLTEAKGVKLFDSNKHILYEKTCDDIDGWINEIESQIVTEDVTRDFTTVNLLVQKQNILETQLKFKEQQVQKLGSTADDLKDLDPETQEKILSKKARVEERFFQMLEPLKLRREKIDEAKQIRQFFLDLEDEKMWISEKMLQATSTDYGKSQLSVQMQQKKNKSLQNDIDQHEPHFESVIGKGEQIIDRNHPRSDEIKPLINQLKLDWQNLLDAAKNRKLNLDESEVIQQYLFDAEEAEAWMGEQELNMISDERARDELGAGKMLNKHEITEQAVEDYADTVRELADRSRQLIEKQQAAGQDSNVVANKQSRVDKQYASLKDLAAERRNRLNEVLKLYKLHYEIDDIEKWIAEKEVVAGAHELGQDFEQVTMLRDRFQDFAKETESIGQDRVGACNEMCDKLIQNGHSDAPIIAEWKDGINEAWTDVLELIDTRTLALNASWELYKFFNDCQETLERIREKQLGIPGDEVAKDAQSIAGLQRRLANFENELILLGTQVQAVQEEAAKLIVAYSGEKAQEIQRRESEVVNAWRNLQFKLDERKHSLADNFDGSKFFSMVRDLMNWMNEINRQILSTEKPRDVSGVELLMNNHSSLRAEIDARNENFTICSNLGKDLIKRRHERSAEVRDKLVQLANQRGSMMDHWEERWHHLKLILEVYQFARDATVAESWLIAHEPLVKNEYCGETLDIVEILLKKHNAFEKTLLTQDERFAALERLTTLEMSGGSKASTRKPSYTDQYLAEFLPPVQVEPKPTPVETVTEPQEKLLDKPKPERPESKVQEKEERKPDVPQPQEKEAPLKEKPTEKAIHETPVKAEPAAPKVVEKTPPKVVEPISPTKPTEKRSKSPFGKLGRSASAGKDKKPSEPVAVRPQEPSLIEGYLNRKHEWENTTRKASDRTWEKIFVTLTPDGLLSSYKDPKHAKTPDLKLYFRHENPIRMEGVTAAPATDYVKRQNVFRLKQPTGGEYLFQCKDEEEMNAWLNQLKRSAGTVPDEAKWQTLPSPSSLEGKRNEPKRRSFFTLGGKKRDSKET